ncbi:DNA -binding domain-containing protein [Azospirillum sp. ST 5-10]|uniref:DNA -binding domain-containing protein n=1 Tax=unclassified Azospirillum TaxID=2630922 RepID=UPI003F4A2D12
MPVVLPEREPVLADAPPQADGVTDYDRAHLVTYLRLLDAEADGADPTEVARIVLGLDPGSEPDRTLRIHAAHLARARWLSRSGHRHLLRMGD